MSEAETVLETLISMVPKELVEKVHGKDSSQYLSIIDKIKVIYGQSQKRYVVTDISGAHRKEYSRYGDACNHFDWCKNNLKNPGVVLIRRGSIHRYSTEDFAEADEAVDTIYNNIME